MIPSLEGLPTKAKEAPSPHEVRLSPLDTNPVFDSLGGFLHHQYHSARDNGQAVIIHDLILNMAYKEAVSYIVSQM